MSKLELLETSRQTKRIKREARAKKDELGEQRKEAIILLTGKVRRDKVEDAIEVVGSGGRRRW
jgi:hypothetical protein